MEIDTDTGRETQREYLKVYDKFRKKIEDMESMS